MSKVNDRIIEKFNNNIGKDIKNLNKSKIIIEQYKKQFDNIEDKLNVESRKSVSIVKDALNQEKLTRDIIILENDKIQRYEYKLNEHLLQCDCILQDVNTNLKDIKYLQHMIEYLKIIEDIQQINNNITLAIKGKNDDSKIVHYYLKLYDDNTSYNTIIGRLQDIDAKHLNKFAIKSTEYWHKVLIDKFSNDFEQLLKSIKWSQQGQVLDELSSSKETIDKLINLAGYLFTIKTPSPNNNDWITITPSIICPPISYTTKLLIKPFRQKFFYHFSGTKKTNRLDKPEWYLTQVLNWIKETHLFVGKNFQTAISKAGYKNFNIRLEYIRGLVQLCIEKLSSDIEEISKDGCLFAHLIDEVLAFDIELKDNFDYPNSFPSLINVLTQPQYIMKWISIERQFCTNQMDLILQSDNNPWMFVIPSGFEDLKIPKCSDQFVRLLDAIKDRYYLLTQPRHKLEFLNLQLELIDNFRTRLVQLHANEIIDSTKVINIINYIICVLREWGENIHYLHLHAALIDPNSNQINSVFEQPIIELEHWQQQLLNDLSTKIVDEIKAKSWLYRRENWSNMPEQNSKEPFILSTSAGEMFQLMVTTIHNLEKELSLNLLITLLRMIANLLDDFFMYSLIMNTKFSIGGASQFRYDMIRNLFPIFGQFIRRPNLLFKKINDACILLNIAQGNALLLCQTLKNLDIPTDEKVKALRELGITHLNPENSLDIIERRINLRIY